MTEYIHKYEIDNNRVYLWGDIDSDTVEHVISHMRYIFFAKTNKVIYLYIHSDGGDVDCCAAIIDEILGLQSIGAKIITVAIGKAFSSAAMILSVGNEKYATANTSLMLHPMSLECPIDYISKQSQYTKFAEKQYNQIITLVAKKCGHKTKAQITDFKAKIKDGLWMNTDEAIEFGLIDNVWDYDWENNYKPRV